MPDAPSFEVGPAPTTSDPWDEDCSLFIEVGGSNESVEGDSPWEAVTSSVSFMPPPSGQMTISFVELVSGFEIERTVTVLSGEAINVVDPVTLKGEPGQEEGWQKTSINIQLNAATQPVKIQFGASGNGEFTVWAIDKLVVGGNP